MTHPAWHWFWFTANVVCMAAQISKGNAALSALSGFVAGVCLITAILAHVMRLAAR